MLFTTISKKLALVFCLFFVISCTSQNAQPTTTPSEEKLSVITTIPAMYSFVANIGGEYVDVENILPIGTSVHSWQPSPSDVITMEDADVIFSLGLGLEAFMQDIGSTVDTPVVAVGEKLHKDDLLEGHAHDHGHDDHEEEHDDHEDEEGHDDYEEEEGHDDHEEEGHDDHEDEELGVDPHVWLNPELSVLMVDEISY